MMPHGNWFGKLVNCNPAVTFATSYSSLTSNDSSIALAGIAVTGGAQPFVFDKGTLAYDVTVPEGVTSVSVACTMQKHGQIIDTLPASTVTREQLGLLMAGIKPDAVPARAVQA